MKVLSDALVIFLEDECCWSITPLSPKIIQLIFVNGFDSKVFFDNVTKDPYLTTRNEFISELLFDKDYVEKHKLHDKF